MNRYKIFILLIVLWINFSFASNAVIYHNQLEPVAKGEKAHLEINIVGMNDDIYEARVFFRSKGDVDFQSQVMREQGYTLSSDLDTRNLSSGQIEYYFAMQTFTGDIITYPEFNPVENPLSFNVVATSAKNAFQNQEEIILLSPEPNEVVPQDELVIALSVPNTEADIDESQTRLLIDGINVSDQLVRDGNVYVLTSDNIRTGSHNGEFKIFGSNGNLLGKKEWSFRVTTGSENVTGFRQRINVFLDNRYQSISKNSDNFFRGGAIWDAKYNAWDFRLKVQTATNDGFSGQSPNRFGTMVAYNFDPSVRLYLKGGDFSGDYDPLSFWNRRIFGFGFGLNSSWVDLDISAGSTANKVEGVLDYTLNADSIAHINKFKTGIFDESFLSIRPEFHFGDHVHWGLNLVNSKEDPKSISTKTYLLKVDTSGTLKPYQLGANPKETLILGTTFKLNFDNNRIRFVSSIQAGINNNDASTEVDFNDLADNLELTGSDRKTGKRVADFLKSTGFLTISQGLAPLPNLAMRFDTYLNYFDNYLQITYKNIDPDYRTPGNPYLINGIRGFFVMDNIRLLENQVFLNLYLKLYEDNLSQKNAITTNNDVGLAISYFPMQSFPGLTLSYGSYSRKNDYDLGSNQYYNPATMDFNPEDNTTQRVSLSSNYSFNTGNIKNTLTFSVSNIERDDKIITQLSNGDLLANNSKFTLYSVALKNQFQAPLISRIGFSKSTSNLGDKGANAYESNIARYYGNLEYTFKQFIGDMNFRPFVNFALSQLDYPLSYNRTNYTAGFLVNSYDYGNLSFRFDYIDFGSRPNTDWKDTLISTRYDVTF